MYILFINSGGKYDIIFLLNLIIIIKKNCPTHGLDLCNELGWVELNFFFYPPLSKKIPSTRSMHTPTYWGLNLTMDRWILSWEQWKGQGCDMNMQCSLQLWDEIVLDAPFTLQVTYA